MKQYLIIIKNKIQIAKIYNLQEISILNLIVKKILKYYKKKIINIKKNIMFNKQTKK